jgi:dTMP kinase
MVNTVGGAIVERAPIISLEGIDGSGKSTQMAMLSERLLALGLDHICIREPGGTDLGEEVRAILLSVTNSVVAFETELFLFLASRAQLVREVIKPAANQGKLILCDRFSDSTIAYQGYGRGLDIDVICSANRLATDGLEPSLTLLYDLDPEVAALRNKKLDRLDTEPRAFHERVRNGYLAIARLNPHRVKVLDARCSPAELAEQTFAACKPILRAVLEPEGVR